MRTEIGCNVGILRWDQAGALKNLSTADWTFVVTVLDPTRDTVLMVEVSAGEPGGSVPVVEGLEADGAASQFPQVNVVDASS
jgi:hypothetical protein